MNQQTAAPPARPRILLVGDASARPGGLERALTRAGFHLLEQDANDNSAPVDAVLITVVDLNEHRLEGLLPDPSGGLPMPPSIVLLSSADPEGPAAALALGATDALAAPVHLPELCARLHARIRERHPNVPPAPAPATNGGSTGAETGRGMLTLDLKLREELERARRYSLSFSLILLGVEDLRSLEERLGAEAAGRLRQGVIQLLRRELRLPDYVVAHGVDEFAIVLPETDQSGARQSLVRVRERLMTLPFEGDPRLEPTRFSAGIVTYPHPAASQSDDLFALAEAALMRGKAQSGERIGIAV